MTNSVRYILLLVGAVIILLLLWDGLRRKKRQQREAPIRTVDLKLMKEKFDEKKIKAQYQDDDSGVIVDPAVASEVTLSPNKVVEPIVAAPVEAPAAVPTAVLAEEAPVQQVVIPKGKPSPFIMLHLEAPEGQSYAGYHLLQSLLASDLQFGERHFFHRYQKDASSILFSVAADEAPGTFNPTQMREYTCTGLMLFMDCDDTDAPKQTFEAMLDAAHALQHQLGGHLYLGRSIPCDDAQIDQLFARHGW